jgi:hypothetical protein
VGGRRPHAGAAALLVHQLLEALVVHREALLGEQLLGQVVGEAVGVVQLECILRVDPGGPVLVGVANQVREHLLAALERAAEALLLVRRPAHHGVALGRQLGIGRRQQLERPIRELLHERRFELDRAALLDCTAHDPAQDVAAILVRRDHALGDQRGRTARMVGEDPHRAGGRSVRLVGTTGQLLGQVDQRPQRVGVEDRMDVLEDRRHALEAHAGVDVLHGELGEDAVLGEVVGHEDVVPVLDEPIGVVAGTVIGTS